MIVSRSAPHPLRPVLVALAVAGILEFALLRFVGAMRFQGTIAGGAASGGVFSTFGAACLDFASVLAFVALLAFALTPVRWRTGWSFVLVGYVLIGAVLPWASAIGPWVPPTFGTISAALTLVIGLVALLRPGSSARRCAVGLLLLAYVCAFTYALTPAIIGPKSLVAPGGPGTLAFGEVLYVVAGFFAFGTWGWSRLATNRIAVYGGLGASLGLAVFFGLGGSPAAAAVTSATGLTLFLPLWLYVFSTFFFATTAFACLLDPKAFPVGAALIFLLIAGLLPGTSYQQALLVLAMTLLAHEERVFEMEQLPLEAPAQ